ncbi:MAG: helix-turn-helix transcriptional regulator [Spirochaetes bacterium]|nr:helix-turn-helix transcriptional regulator [Spirochaetota bacterium]
MPNPAIAPSAMRLCLINTFHLTRNAKKNRHSVVELGYVARGAIALHTDSKRLECPTHSLFLIPPRLSHRESLDHCESAFLLYAQIDGFDWGAPHPTVVRLSARHPIKALLFSLVEEQAHPGPDSAPFLRHSLELLRLQVLRAMALPRASPSPNPRLLLKRIRDIIDNRFMESAFGVAALSRELGISARSVELAVKAEAQSTPSELILDSRLTHAEGLLRETNHRLREIARKCGFADEGYFIRRFRQSRGATPIAWRKRFALGERPPP